MEQSQTQSKPLPAAGKSTAKSAARFISDAANPLLMPVWIIIAAGILLDIPSFQFGMITLSAFAFFTLIPFGIVIYLLQSGKILSLDVPFQRNRNRLFVYSIMSTTTGSILLFLLSYSDYHFLAMASGVFLLNPMIAYLLNQGFKISIHTAGVATAGILFFVLGEYTAGTNIWPLGLSFFTLLVLLPVMFWSRRKLGIHTLPELAAGSFAGIIFTLLITGLMKMI
ncbi:MAG: hypothetical protein R3222_07580 [Balneolaceae bacterium]|nr:hypothetical protein [Balneolaceae bacterium]